MERCLILGKKKKEEAAKQEIGVKGVLLGQPKMINLSSCDDVMAILDPQWQQSLFTQPLDDLSGKCQTKVFFCLGSDDRCCHNCADGCRGEERQERG